MAHQNQRKHLLLFSTFRLITAICPENSAALSRLLVCFHSTNPEVEVMSFFSDGCTHTDATGTKTNWTGQDLAPGDRIYVTPSKSIKVRPHRKRVSDLD